MNSKKRRIGEYLLTINKYLIPTFPSLDIWWEIEAIRTTGFSRSVYYLLVVLYFTPTKVSKVQKNLTVIQVTIYKIISVYKKCEEVCVHIREKVEQKSIVSNRSGFTSPYCSSSDGK